MVFSQSVKSVVLVAQMAVAIASPVKPVSVLMPTILPSVSRPHPLLRPIRFVQTAASAVGRPALPVRHRVKRALAARRTIASFVQPANIH
jgi:hypothetical protein